MRIKILVLVLVLISTTAFANDIKEVGVRDNNLILITNIPIDQAMVRINWTSEFLLIVLPDWLSNWYEWHGKLTLGENHISLTNFIRIDGKNFNHKEYDVTTVAVYNGTHCEVAKFESNPLGILNNQDNE